MHHGDANARVAEAETAYDVFVVAKYVADPLHGTADKTAELINDIPAAANPSTPPKPGSQRIRLRTHRPTMQRHRMATRHTHRRPHILHSRTLPMPRMRRRRRDTKRRMPVPGIRRIRKRLGMQRKASCTPSPRKAPRQAHSIWR